MFVDALLAFPALVFAALVVGRAQALSESDIEVLGFGFSWLSNAWAITLVFAVLSIAPLSRIVRAQTLSVVAAGVRARCPQPRRERRRGSCSGRSCPTSCPSSCRSLFTGVAILLAAEAGLAFLGYSVEAPQASWGLMVAENRERDRHGVVGDVLPVPDAVPDRAGVQPHRRPRAPVGSTSARPCCEPSD